MKCKFCDTDDLPDKAKRCRECGSWLSSWSYIWHPETIPKLIALLIAVGAAFITWQQASDARRERRAVDELKQDIVVIAENMTKMAYVIADGSVYFDGIPKQHMKKIDDYKNALQKYLSPTIDKDIKETLKELNKGVKR
jgi:hypothetical protein